MKFPRITGITAEDALKFSEGMARARQNAAYAQALLQAKEASKAGGDWIVQVGLVTQPPTNVPLTAAEVAGVVDYLVGVLDARLEKEGRALEAVKLPARPEPVPINR